MNLFSSQIIRNHLKVVAVSGGFDPLTTGHLDYIHNARQYGNFLVVILNTDDFLMRKKGYVFMPYEKRQKVLYALRDVDLVFKSIDEDQTVKKSLLEVHPNVFCKGGDRTVSNTPELNICRANDIEVVFGVGDSSSWLVDNVIKQMEKNKKNV